MSSTGRCITLEMWMHIIWPPVACWVLLILQKPSNLCRKFTLTLLTGVHWTVNSITNAFFWQTLLLFTVSYSILFCLLRLVNTVNFDTPSPQGLQTRCCRPVVCHCLRRAGFSWLPAYGLQTTGIFGVKPKTGANKFWTALSCLQFP